MLTKTLAPTPAPLRTGRRAAAGRGRGRGAGVLTFAGAVRTVGRSASGRELAGVLRSPVRGVRRGGSLLLDDSRFAAAPRGVSRFGGSRRGGSGLFCGSLDGSRLGGSALRGSRRGGSEPRGGTWGRRGCPAWERGVAEGRLGVPLGSPGRGGRLSTPAPLATSGYTK
ncbi:hypothetical protein [Lentzea sp. NPDC060358]|uniref:hypothetical protein n=1 Tax=Lentzea sp. NPDC060358 TaxID=3347103 RepID=UPI00365E0315